MRRKIYSEIKDILIRVLIFVIIPRRKNILITCSGKTDGMGAQVQAIFSAYLYATMIKKKFIYTPLKIVEHNYENSNNWEKLIEDFFELKSFNAIKNNNRYRTYNLDNLSIFDYCKILLSIRPILIEKQHFHEYADRHPQNYNYVKPNLTNNFFRKTHSYKRHGLKGRLIIAYHIRRGDVNIGNHSFRFTSNEIIIQNIKTLTHFLKRNNIIYEIHIYSQGTEEHFGEISTLGVLHLNEDPFETLYNLIVSDVLFTAKSSFSYIAALLSKGVIVYEPFWHSPLPEWHISSPDLFLYNSVQEAIKTTFAQIVSKQ